TIVDQGEGAPGHTENSHYSRFLAIRRELDELSDADPSFVPAHPVAHNPVMRRPPDPTGRVFVEDTQAALVLDFANALYGHMLRCLAAAYGRPTAESSTKRVMIETAIDLMRVL